jgi:hypothetical protein
MKSNGMQDNEEHLGQKKGNGTGQTLKSMTMLGEPVGKMFAADHHMPAHHFVTPSIANKHALLKFDPQQTSEAARCAFCTIRSEPLGKCDMAVEAEPVGGALGNIPPFASNKPHVRGNGRTLCTHKMVLARAMIQQKGQLQHCESCTCCSPCACIPMCC